MGRGCFGLGREAMRVTRGEPWGGGAFEGGYEESRARFLAAVEGAGGVLSSLILPGAEACEKAVQIDLGWLGPVHPKRVVVHLGGVRGIDGEVGEAIQCELLEQLEALPSETALLLIHSVNPYGQQKGRLVNAHNVDLRYNWFRRCVADPARMWPLDRFLHPSTPALTQSALAFLLYLLEGVTYLLRQGVKGLNQLFAEGQHVYPKGVFFGGFELQPEWESLVHWLQPRLEGVEEVTWMAVQTGAGEYGAEECCVRAPYFSVGFEPNREEKRDFLLALARRVAPLAKNCLVHQRFGVGARYHTLFAMREENRNHFFLNKNQKELPIHHSTKKQLLLTFVPEDPLWRDSCVHLGVEGLLERVRGVDGKRRNNG